MAIPAALGELVRPVDPLPGLILIAAGPEVSNTVTMAYAIARTSSGTSPCSEAAAMLNSVPSARCPLRNQYQPTAATSRIASWAQPSAIAPRRAALMLSCSVSSVDSHSSCSARRRCGSAVSASSVK